MAGSACAGGIEKPKNVVAIKIPYKRSTTLLDANLHPPPLTIDSSADFVGLQRGKEKQSQTPPPQTPSVSHVLENLSYLQKKEVISVGFGGLLGRTISNFPEDLTQWLLKHFCPHARAFRDNDGKAVFTISPRDVQDTFLFPNHPGVTVNVKDRSLGRDANNSVRVTNKPPVMLTSELVQRMEVVGHGDQFKKTFVLWILSAFLAPTADNRVDFTPLPSLTNTNEIRLFDWSEFVLNKFCEAVVTYNAEGGCGHFYGCIAILLYPCLQSLRWNGVLPSPKIPFIQNWDKEDAVGRIKQLVDSWETGECQVLPNVLSSSAALLTFEVPTDVLTDGDLQALYPNGYERSVATLCRDLKVVAGDRLQSITQGARVVSGGMVQQLPELLSDVESLISFFVSVRNYLESLHTDNKKAPIAAATTFSGNVGHMLSSNAPDLTTTVGINLLTQQNSCNLEDGVDDTKTSDMQPMHYWYGDRTSQMEIDQGIGSDDNDLQAFLDSLHCPTL